MLCLTFYFPFRNYYFLFLNGGGGIKSFGEEYHLVKRGRKYHCCGEEYNVEKRNNNIVIPLIFRLLGKNIKFWRREGNIMALGENITLKERSNIIFPIILRLLGRISSGEKGKGTDILGKKIRILEMGVGGISSCRELYTPLFPFLKYCYISILCNGFLVSTPKERRIVCAPSAT